MGESDMDKKMKGTAPADIREMDGLFRRADFAADVPCLAMRILGKIRARRETDDCELAEEELSALAAAGIPYFCRDLPKREGKP